MTRQLTIDDATVFNVAAKITGHGKRTIRVYQSRDWKNRPGWMARAKATHYLTGDLVMRRTPEGYAWLKTWSAGEQPHFATPQEALDAAIQAGAVIA